MPAWLPAAIMGGASLLGGAQAQRAARQESARNRRFQERMSSTSWQRAVGDMEAAGINPALAYSQGGASSPGGSMAAQADMISPSVSSAMQMRRMQADLQQIEAATDKLKAEGKSAKAAALLAEARVDAYGIDRGKLSGRVRFNDPSKMEGLEDFSNPFLELVAAEVDTARQNARFARSKADIAGPAAELSENMGQWLPLLALATKFNPSGIISAVRRKPTTITKVFKR